MSKISNWGKHEPDELDKNCSKVFEVIDYLTTQGKIDVLEQCLDWLRLDLANQEESQRGV